MLTRSVPAALGCRMADLGMNIVTVIHQPRYSVFSLFHEVLLLGKAGRTVFQGLSRWAHARMCLHLLFGPPQRRH